MRSSTLLVLLALVGCAPLSRLTHPGGSSLSVSEDGRTASAGGETWTAPDEIAFYQRGSVLHVVASSHGREWDVAVPLGEGGRLAWPADAPFEAAGGQLKLKAGKLSPEISRLIDTGQLHPHDDHFHLTHGLQDEDWQALYRDRAEDSPLPPIRRQVAATILALLIDERIPGSSPEATEKALARMRSIIRKARRAIEADVGARAIEAIVTHDFEIRDEGRTLEVAGQVFRAEGAIRFAYCARHFHVEDAGGKWAQPIELEGQAPGAFAWPGSIFYEVRAGGTIAERSSTTRWRTLSDAGQVRFTRDHWHLTEAYPNPRLQKLLKAMDDPKVAAPQRERARAMALELLRLRLDTGSDAEFEARLSAIDQAIDRAWTELEKDIRHGSAPTKG